MIHKYVLKIFNGLKNCVKFMKIVTLFLISMLCLYWMQNLIGTEWAWMDFVKPILEVFVDKGESINSTSVASFEMKYVMAFLLFLAVYGLWHLCYLFLEIMERGYDFGRFQYKRMEEKNFNNQMAAVQSKEQKKLQNYYVYIKLTEKNNFSAKIGNINIEEQEKQVNKFLIEQTSVSPVRFEGGFLYEFARFDKIDSILSAFFKILHTESHFGYQIYVLLREGNKELEMEKLRKLISLGLINKISALADVVYRYGFIEHTKYETSSLGLFQKGTDTYEMHEFINGIQF